MQRARPPFGSVLSCSAALVLLVSSGGCQGCGPVVSGITPSFAISPDTQVVDFGRVAQGQVVRKKVTVVAEARAPVALSLRTQAPFATQPTAQLEASASVDVSVTFTAGTGAVEGELRVIGDNGQERRAVLRGTGVVVETCLAQDPCTDSTFSVELGRCVETPKPEDGACTPRSVCLTDGRCRSGQCLGVARRCDDGNACTQDGCSEDAGCVNLPITCPGAAERCEVGVCDRQTGCRLAPAPDNEPCGPGDCVNVNLCRGGRCTELPTPDGVICGQPVACIGEARCRMQRCERPDAGPYGPSFSTPLPGALTSPLRSADGTLYVSRCGVPLRLPDGGRGDAGCALVSFTGNGFERFGTPLADGGHARLLGVGSNGTLLVEGDALVLRRALDDGLGWSTELPGAVEVAAMERSGAVWLIVRPDAGSDGGAAADGGADEDAGADAGPLADVRAVLLHVVDGGAQTISLPSDPRFVVADRRGAVWVSTPDGVLQLEDAGVVALLPVDGGARRLAVTEDSLWVDGAGLLRVRQADGGARLLLLSQTDDAGVAVRHQPTPSLFGNGRALTTYRRCRTLLMSCAPEFEETWARVVNATTGAVEYDAQLVPAQVEGVLHEVALLSVLPGAFAAVASGAADAGRVAALQLVMGSDLRLLCPLPSTSADVRQAHFSGSTLYVVVGLPDGGARLEGYPLHSVQAATAGWPQADGRSGLLREE